MFKHILLPTDGTAAARPGIDACLRFAREIGARVTALHVAPALHIFTYEPGVTESVRQTVIKDRELHSKKYLDDVGQRAAAAGVPCQSLLVTSDFPHEAIIEAARAHQCDLIAMASHGRGGIKGMLLGSETQKVLTHSAIPVIVWRAGGAAAGAPTRFLS